MMGNRTHLAFAGLCLAAVVGLAGCAASTTGTASPAPAGHSPRPAVQAPKVAQPLDPTAMVTAPCTSLTTANVLSLGLDNPQSKANRSDGESDCAWAGESGGNMGVTWNTDSRHGLTDQYREQTTFAYWIPTTIDGYPAVYGDSLGDHRADGDCVLNVGVSDRLTFFVEYDNPLRPSQGCVGAKTAATDVIVNLKASI
jgi:hypothetical protein